MPSTCETEPEVPDRRPKALRYEVELNAIEKMIIDGLPEVVAKLLSMAKEGNVAASRYLVDRIFGRPARVMVPPAVDKALAHTYADWTSDLLRQKERREEVMSRWIPKTGSSKAKSPRAPIPGVSATVDGSPSLEEIRREIDRLKAAGN